MLLRFPLAALALAAACSGGGGPGDDWCAAGPTVDRVDVAGLVLPGSEFAISGTGFDARCGTVRVLFRGTFDGRAVEFEATPTAATATLVRYAAGAELAVGLGADTGRFEGQVGVRLVPASGESAEAVVPVSFDRAVLLQPELASVSPVAVTLNALVLVSGDGFLEGAEGVTEAVLDGTFTAESGSPREVRGVRIAAAPAEAHDRTRAQFPFAPEIGGIAPGSFSGTLRVDNLHASGASESSAAVTAAFDLGPSFITRFSPARPTIGSIVTIEGAGFIGGAFDQTLTVRLDGTATPRGRDPQAIADLELVPAFVDGGHAAYTIVPIAAAGELIAEDFGFSWGAFSGTATPVLRYGTEHVEGLPTTIAVAIGPTKQVVLVSFLAGFSDAVREFGLQAVEADVRLQVLDKFRRTFAGVNVDVRDAWPEDYYVGGYAVVEIGGPDPNGRGLFGYDNTPGKDVGNLRLHDRIGGANAEVQEDGYPGYGGIFVLSFFCWSSRRPAGLVCPDGIHDAEFDGIFDPLRRREAVAGEYPAGPDPARTAQIAAAIRALGNLVGDTAAHEFGHSLGLAHPYGPPDLVHNEPPAEGCLMDAGAYRPFSERAELAGATPGGFCGDERGYLETILPLEP